MNYAISASSYNLNLILLYMTLIVLNIKLILVYKLWCSEIPAISHIIS